MNHDLINLRSVDLNLLTLFDALLDERQLSRAASKLGMSQSAASNALSRLRLTFKDELFIRTREGMEPTPKAQQLALPIREGLNAIRSALTDEAQFNPATSQRTFRLLLNDFIEPILLPKLLKVIQESGDQLSLESFNGQHQDNLDRLRKGQIDFYFDLKPPEDSQLTCEKVYEETLSVIASHNHPRLQHSITIDDYLEERHIVYTRHDGQKTSLDLALEAHQPIARKVLIQASHLSVVPELVQQSDALATMPTQTAQRVCSSYDLQRFDFPLGIGALPLFMIWHKALDSDSAHQWFKQQILNVTLQSKDPEP